MNFIQTRTQSLMAGLLLLLLSISSVAQNAQLKAMSYNIRCGSCEAPTNPNSWDKRKFLLAHLIHSHNPDIIGLQEAEVDQVEDLVTMLKHYSWIGVGREDGKNKGETTAILFRQGRFSLQAQQNLWLSQTPQRASLGWDATFKRTLSIAKLLDNQSKQTLYVFNAHFDNVGELARQESAKLLLQQAAAIEENSPLVVTGDFNFVAGSSGYDIMTSTLADAGTISTLPTMGGNKTYNGFGENTETDNKIDFIFVRKGINVLRHEVDTTKYNNSYASDHYPVIALLDTKFEVQAAIPATAPSATPSSTPSTTASPASSVTP